MTPALDSSITKLGMVRFAVSQQSTVSGGKGGMGWTVTLPAFMHDVLPPEMMAQLPPSSGRREAAAPAPSARALAPREKPAATPPPPSLRPPSLRPPSLLGMPWRWL